MHEYFERETENSVLLENRFLLEEKLPIKAKSGMDWELKKFPNRLIKKFKFKKRKHLSNFLGDVIDYENETQHHAEIVVRYKTVTIKVWTHTLNDVTEVDMEYARMINEIYRDSNASIDE